jgi:hypothetical protein
VINLNNTIIASKVWCKEVCWKSITSFLAKRSNGTWLEKPDSVSLTKVLKTDVGNTVTFQIWNFKHLRACSFHILCFNDSSSSLYCNTQFYHCTTLNDPTSEFVSFQPFTVDLIITMVFWVIIPLTIMFLPSFRGMCYVLLQDDSWFVWMLKWLAWGYLVLIGLCIVRERAIALYRANGNWMFEVEQYLNKTVATYKLIILHLCSDREDHYLNIKKNCLSCLQNLKHQLWLPGMEEYKCIHWPHR